MILAFAATFLAGAAVFGVFSDYEAEAKPKKPKPLPCPPLCPMNATLAQFRVNHNQLDETSASLIVLVDEMELNQDEFNSEQRLVAITELTGIREAAIVIEQTALDGINIFD